MTKMCCKKEKSVAKFPQNYGLFPMQVSLLKTELYLPYGKSDVNSNFSFVLRHEIYINLFSDFTKT